MNFDGAGTDTDSLCVTVDGCVSDGSSIDGTADTMIKQRDGSAVTNTSPESAMVLTASLENSAVNNGVIVYYVVSTTSALDFDGA